MTRLEMYNNFYALKKSGVTCSNMEFFHEVERIVDFWKECSDHRVNDLLSASLANMLYVHCIVTAEEATELLAKMQITVKRIVACSDNISTMVFIKAAQ